MACDDCPPAPKCPDGIPAWVMTFADLMSLLLAFFVLLFSFSDMIPWLMYCVSIQQFFINLHAESGLVV